MKWPTGARCGETALGEAALPIRRAANRQPGHDVQSVTGEFLGPDVIRIHPGGVEHLLDPTHHGRRASHVGPRRLPANRTWCGSACTGSSLSLMLMPGMTRRGL